MVVCIATVFAALFVTPSIFAAPVGEGGTISIPLHKRGSSLSKDGVVIGPALARQLEKARAKYAKGNIAHKFNTGHSLFSGANSAPPVKRQNEPLTDEQEELWAGPITIGTPGQSFIIDFDTGSADLWVASSECTSQGCSPHSKYDPSKSSTVNKREGNFNITYGDMSTASGPIYSDVVTVAGLSVTNQSFSAVTSESDEFIQDPSDGILGLAFSSISAIGAPTFIENLYVQGKISAPTFSFRLASSGSELFIGGVDNSKYTGDITWAPITNKTYWLTEGSSNVNGASVYSGGMIIDSGTTLILGSSTSVDSWWKRVQGSAPCDIRVCNTTGFYTYPCSSPPSVSFIFMGAADVSAAACIGPVAGSNGLPDNAWIVGDTFMKNVYTVFDEANSRVGFATPA